MNILFIGGYGNGLDANSICVWNMAQEMISNGHRVWLLAMGNDYVEAPIVKEGIIVLELPMDYYRKLTGRVRQSKKKYLRLWFKLVSAIRHVALLATYPLTSPRRSFRLAAMAKQIVSENEIKVVVTIFNPYDNIYAGIKVKNTFGDNVKVVSYHLDLRTASLNPSGLVRSYIRKHALKSLVKESNIVDKMLIPYSGQKETEQVKGIRKDKLLFVGLPMYITEAKIEICELPFEVGNINISYIGSISKDNRNPSYALSLLEKVSAMIKRKIIVHFWGNTGDIQDELTKSPIAAYHGMIDNRYSRYVMERSDFLLNIGNAIAFDMLPSKIFSMFATGKPIINFIKHPQDVSIPFFEHYAYGIDLKEFEKKNNDVIYLALEMERMKNSPLKDVDGLFDGFKPKTICSLILN